jgi:hypothetical protein
MSEFDELIVSGLTECEAVIPATIKIGAIEYAGTFSELTIQDSADFGGIDSEVTGVFILRKALHPARPVDLSRVQVNGEQRKISGVTDDGPAWNLGISK